jgi:protein O-mannosyl-transferase
MTAGTLHADSRTSAAQSAALLGLLCVAVWLVYGQSLRAPFVFDDSFSVVNNTSITKLWPLVGDAKHPGPLNPPQELPTSGRPLVNLSFAINYRLGGLDPLGYHVVNVLLHMLSTCLVWAIVRRTLRLDYFGGRFAGAADLLAFCTALVWAVHPLNTEAVQYVTQRTELMLGLFYLATLYASMRYWEASPASQSKWLALAVVACMAGMASKEAMV